MRRWILLSLAGLLALAAAAQREQDFAARFMALYGDRHCLTCKTISPKMMERIMKLNAVGESAQAKAVLFFILVAAIGLFQLTSTRKKEVQQ